MKIIIISLMIISTFFIFNINNFNTTTSMPSINESEKSCIFLSVPYSSNIIGITGMDGEGGEEDTGPESFFVTEDNHIYILDSNNNQILHFFNSNVVESIKIESKERMIDIAIADNKIYILNNNNEILKIDHTGLILERINVSSYGYTEKVKTKDFTAEIVIKSKSLNYEDGCLKVLFEDGKEYNLSNSKLSMVEKNIGITGKGFAAITSGNSKIEFPSFSQPVAAYILKSTKDYNIYYTSEIYNDFGKTIMDRRLYFTSYGKIIKYVQLEQTQFSLPNRLFRVMKDGTVYQMITTKNNLSIIKLPFLKIIYQNQHI